MMQQKDKVLPTHVSVIMDGNGRWALSHGMKRMEGHRMGVEAVRAVTECAVEQGIPYLSLFAFSEENWARPKEEVQTLMSLMIEAIANETPTLMKNDIRCLFIGERAHLAESVLHKMDECMRVTKDNKRMQLIIALSYSGKWDILQAVNAHLNRCFASDCKELLTPEALDALLATASIPDPDLLIRTSGEQRISNFMLWQLAYTELYFTPVLWPDFRKLDFMSALEAYSNRKRRFGKTD